MAPTTTKPPPLHQQALRFFLDTAHGRNALSRLIPPALLAADALLCALVIWKVPYTEIDWTAYMQQVQQYVSGERDYTVIKGGTGPLVYPAAHVYFYTALYYVTDEGRDIALAQWIFAGVYLAGLAVVMACYRVAKAPPYILPLLLLSKRLHSIFMLRLFNDGLASLFLFLSTYLFQRRLWTAGALVYSLGLGIKMSLLLVLPAVGVVLFLGRGFFPSLRLANLIVQLQLLLAVPFLMVNPWGYLGRAFEFSRQFFFKWTVNWRFVGEDVFLSKPFSILLLAVHVSLLFLFITTRWLKPARKSIPAIIQPILDGTVPFTPEEERAVSRNVTPKYILTTVLTANVIGLLCARSLHYQFYAYLAWSTPFLLWRAGVHPVLMYGLFFAQEWAWNVYPSTPVSSGVVVGVMAVTVGAVWVGARDDGEVPAVKSEEAKR